ncbi:MAG: response regulator, partial [Candidatus Obscuribacterales bacterium]|nr:response regulator [Steroidobacteraceae bacterium]
ALGMLAALGCHASVAVDGAQAVEMFCTAHYDMIMMDCHMPVMDGYSATTAIRAIELERGHTRIAVVALTANAMEGGRERCLAAGMDDFLTKPFTMAQIRGLIERWTHQVLSDIETPPPVTTRSHADQYTDNGGEHASLIAGTILDTRAISAIQALRSPDLLARIIDLYVVRAPELIRDGHAAMLANDAARLATAAHELKSSSANLGGERLSRVCKECELAARKNELASARNAWINVCAEFDRFRGALDGLRATTSASG